MPRFATIFRLLLGVLLIAASAQGQAPELKSFLGWMPVQPVTAGGDLVLDMHRF